MEKILGKFELNEVKSLVVDSYRGVSSVEGVTPAERYAGANDILKELSKDYRNNKNQIFAIIEEVITEVLPKRLDETVGRFAEIKEFKEGDTPKFSVKNGQIKAYTTALGGTVQRHRRDKRTITVETEATQIKVYEELPRVRAGLVDFNELIEDALDELEKEFYNRIHTALIGTYAVLPDANKHSSTTVKERELDKLIQVVKSYGDPIILGTSLGLAELPLTDSSDARNDLYKDGKVRFYKGRPVIELDNAVTDETNEEFALDDRYLYIIPEGKEKVVKVAIEGDAYVREENGQDWTLNFETLVQNGVAVLQTNHFAMYENTSLASDK